MVQLLPSSLSPQLKVLTVCEWLNELRHNKKKKKRSSGQTLTFLKKERKKKTTKVAKRGNPSDVTVLAK